MLGTKHRLFDSTKHNHLMIRQPTNYKCTPHSLQLNSTAQHDGSVRFGENLLQYTV